MGRFYKTSKPEFLDFMYKMPETAFLKAIETADKQVASKEKALVDLEGRLKSNALTPDHAKRKEIIDQYKQRINEESQKLLADPLSYRRNIKPIKQLSDDIYENWTRGEIASIEANYNARAAWDKQYDALVKAKIIRPHDKHAALAYFDKTFAMQKGTQYKGEGDYNMYSTEDIVPYLDIVDYVDKHGTGWKENLESQLGGKVSQMGDGRYIVTQGKKVRYVDEKEILGGIEGIIKNNPELRDYYQQRIKFGQMSAEDAVGQMTAARNFAIQKFGFKQVEKSLKYQVEKGWLEDKKLANKIRFGQWKKREEKNGAIGLDYNNEQVKYSNVLATNYKDYVTTLKAETQAAINSGTSIINTIKNDVMQQLKDGTMTTEEANKLYEAGKLAEKALQNGDYNALNDIAKDLNYDQKIVSQIEELQKQATTYINYENQINIVKDHFTNEIKTQNRNAIINSLKNNPDIFYDEKTRTYTNIKTNEVIDVEKEIASQFDANDEKQVEAQVDAWLSNDKNNTTTQSIYSTSGGIFDLIDPNNLIDPKIKDRYKFAVKDVGQAIAANPEGWGDQFYVVGEDGQIQNTSLADALASQGIIMNNVNKTEDADGNTKYVTGDKTVNIKNSDARLTLNKIKGEYQYQIPFIANGKEGEIYIPVSKIKNQEMDEVLGYLKPMLKTDEVIREAKRVLGPLQSMKKPEELSFQTDQPSIKYYPYVKDKSTGKTTPMWKITDESTGDTDWYSDLEGQNIYQQTVQPTHQLKDKSYDAGTGASGSSFSIQSNK